MFCDFLIVACVTVVLGFYLIIIINPNFLAAIYYSLLLINQPDYLSLLQYTTIMIRRRRR